MSRIEITDVVEVVETRSRRVAQVFLDRGYVVLNVGGVHFDARDKATGAPTVRRGTEYVLGRGAETASLTLSDAIAVVATQRAEAQQQ